MSAEVSVCLTPDTLGDYADAVAAAAAAAAAAGVLVLTPLEVAPGMNSLLLYLRAITPGPSLLLLLLLLPAGFLVLTPLVLAPTSLHQACQQRCLCASHVVPCFSLLLLLLLLLLLQVPWC
jgi:hypothetical protein